MMNPESDQYSPLYAHFPKDAVGEPIASRVPSPEASPISTLTIETAAGRTRARRIFLKALPYLVLATGCVVYLYQFIRLFAGGGDEGTLIDGAVRITEGQVPFRDFFEVMGPGTFYWLAMFFKLFGTTWIATRISLIVTLVVTALLIYFLTRRLRTGFEAAPALFCLAISFPPWPSVSHHAVANLFALLSFAILVSWIDKRRGMMLFICGVMAGLTTCVMQPKGLLLFISFVVILWGLCRKELSYRSSIAGLIAGYLAVGLSVFLLFWSARALPDMLYANLIWPLSSYGSVNAVPYGLNLGEYWDAWATSLKPVISTAGGVCAASLLAVPFLVVMTLPLFLIFFGLRQRSLAFNRVTLPYWVAGSALWLSEIHRKDLTHLVYGSPLLIILCFYLFRRQRRGFSLSALKFVAMCAILLAALNSLVAGSAQTQTDTRRGMVYTFGHDAIIDFLNARVAPGEDIFIYPYRPLYYFFAAARNPTRFSILMYHYNTDSQLHEVVRSLEQSHVRNVLWDTVTGGDNIQAHFPAYKAPSPAELIIEPFLTEHYDLVEYKDNFRILERKPLAR